MNGNDKKISRWVRLVLAVGGKDITDAIKNRITISIILGVAMIVLTGRLLPLAMKLRPEKRAYIYDASGSTFVAEYGRGDSYRLVEMPSEGVMLREVGGTVAGTIGLSLPADLEAILEGEESLEIEAYYAHALTRSEKDELVALFTSGLSDALNREVIINTEGNELFPAPDAGGHPFMVSISLAISILTIGMALVPLLMIEEKERHTIDALLVSPASYGQIVLGKALAGMFYCTVAALVVYTLNYSLLATGWVAMLAVLAGALFTVGVGLLLGVLFEQQANMNMVMGLVLIVLMIPMLLSLAPAANIPASLKTALPYLPSVAMGKLFSMSFSINIDAPALLFNLSVLFGFTIVLFLTVTWRVKRMDR
jgi:ABC-2 type transport system permease protein